jgi:hypothetical protein
VCRLCLRKGAVYRCDFSQVAHGCAARLQVVLWVRLSKWQLELYSRFLGSEEVNTAKETTSSSPLLALNVLRKISLHPALLNQRVRDQLHMPPTGACPRHCAAALQYVYLPCKWFAEERERCFVVWCGVVWCGSLVVFGVCMCVVVVVCVCVGGGGGVGP